MNNRASAAEQWRALNQAAIGENMQLVEEMTPAYHHEPIPDANLYWGNQTRSPQNDDVSAEQAPVLRPETDPLLTAIGFSDQEQVIVQRFMNQRSEMLLQQGQREHPFATMVQSADAFLGMVARGAGGYIDIDQDQKTGVPFLIHTMPRFSDSHQPMMIETRALHGSAVVNGRHIPVIKYTIGGRSWDEKDALRTAYIAGERKVSPESFTPEPQPQVDYIHRLQILELDRDYFS